MSTGNNEPSSAGAPSDLDEAEREDLLARLEASRLDKAMDDRDDLV